MSNGKGQIHERLKQKVELLLLKYRQIEKRVLEQEEEIERLRLSVQEHEKQEEIAERERVCSNVAMLLTEQNEEGVLEKIDKMMQEVEGCIAMLDEVED